MQTEEEFYAVKWSILKENGTPILLAAGRQGMIRVLDCHKQKLLWASPYVFKHLYEGRLISKVACWLAESLGVIASHGAVNLVSGVGQACADNQRCL